MKVSANLKGKPYYTDEEYNTYSFGKEPTISLGHQGIERDAEFEVLFEELNEYYQILSGLGIAPIIREINGNRYKLVNHLLPAWKKVAEMANEEWSVSPYGDSWYSSKEISWEYKPEGSLRIADHWNFVTKDGKKHCQTTDGDLKEGWAIGRFVGGKYEIIEMI